MVAVCISGNGPTLVACKNDGATFTYMWNRTFGSGGMPKGGSCTLSKTSGGMQKSGSSGLSESSSGMPQGGSCGAFETHSIFLPRILQFKSEFNSVFNHADFFLGCPEYLIHAITQEKAKVAVLPEARFESAYWTKELFSKFEIPNEKFSEFCPIGTKCGNLSKEILTEFKLNCESKIPVFASSVDFVTALIGTGTVRVGKICDRSGSSEGLNLCTKSNLQNSTKLETLEFRILPSVISNLWNKSVLINDSGTRLSTWKKTSPWREKTYEECIRDLLNQKTDISKEGRKILDSILADYCIAVQKLSAEAKNSNETLDDKIICTGGQAKNTEWMQLKSNAARKTLCTTNCLDSELMGSAIVAFTSLGAFENIEQACSQLIKIEKTYWAR